MTRKKSLIQRLKEWTQNTSSEDQPKAPKLTKEQEELIKKTMGIAAGSAIAIKVNPNPTKALNVKMYPEDFARLEQISALIADGNQSATVRKAIGVIYDDMVEKGLIKVS